MITLMAANGQGIVIYVDVSRQTRLFSAQSYSRHLRMSTSLGMTASANQWQLSQQTMKKTLTVAK